MKSMLHEASSIIKAIEKAWIESGRPTEFTIKILENGEKNFFGMTKRPAILSITYGSKIGPERPRNKNFVQTRPLKKMQEVGSVQTQGKQIQKGGARDEPGRYEPSGIQHQRREAVLVKEKPLDQEIHDWNNELADYCSANLKEFLIMLKIESSFITKINNKTLVITFDKTITSAVTDELKSFFASLAHLLMQLLKKKHKKKFKGLQIIINHTISHDTSNPNKLN